LAFDVANLSPVVAAMFVLSIILSIVVTSIPVVLAVFTADVLAVNPMMPEARHVARDPDHFIVAVPIARAMVVERPVANLD
jgi:hypothetical protein